MTEKEKKPRPKPTGKRHLTARQWAESETLYALGDTTLTEIADKHSLSMQAVFQHMKRKGIKKGERKEAHAKAIAEGIEKASVSDASIMASRIKETKEDHYKMASGLAKLTWSEILKTKQDGVPVSSAINNLRALDSAMTVLKKAREERYAVLGLDRADFVDEEGLPELVISELTAEQIAKLQERDEDFEAMNTDDNDVMDFDDETEDGE